MRRAAEAAAAAAAQTWRRLAAPPLAVAVPGGDSCLVRLTHAGFAAAAAAASSSSSSSSGGRLAGKVALITGGGSGIGKASCELFAREGARVVVADVREDAASDVARGIRDAGHAAVHVSGDVSNADHARAMVEAAEREFGALHVLFNNAGVMLAGDDRPEDTDEEVITKTLNVNVKGVINGCKFGIPAMRRAGGGSIVNTASFVALMGAATPQIAYTASKGAVLALTREIAVIHARENIRANALCPGPLRTELLMKFLDTDDKRRRRLVHIPVGRFGEATEMARAALFLASDVDSSFMTGAALVVDGGITAAYVTPE